MKKIETLFKTEAAGVFATPKKENRSTKIIPETLVETLNAGNFTSEMLNELTVQFPVFRYRTQITIHGVWGEVNTSYIGRYKNLVKNGNASLGVRYSAIDVHKRHQIAADLRAVESDFKYSENSQSSEFYLSATVKNREQIETQKAKFQIVAERIKTANFWGDVQINLYAIPFADYYIMRLEVDVCAVPAEHVREVTLQLANMEGAEFDRVKTAYEAAEAAKEAQRDADYKESQARRETQRFNEAMARVELAKSIEHLPVSKDLTQGTLVKVATDREGKAYFRFVKQTGRAPFGRIQCSRTHSYTLPTNQQELDALTWVADKKTVKPDEITEAGVSHALSFESAAKPEPIKAAAKATTKTQSKVRMELVVHLHSKRNCDVYVATLADRVERDQYSQLLGAAKAKGGWYSKSFDGSPAGFMFTKQEQAEAFISEHS